MDYRKKYLKYKNKYNNYCNQLGGTLQLASSNSSVTGEDQDEYMPPTSGFEPELSQLAVNPDENIIDVQDVNMTVQTGGAFAFKSNTVLFVLANLTDSALLNAYKQRIDLLLAYVSKPKVPHITLFELHINQDHPAAQYFSSPLFQQAVKDIYTRTFADIELKSPFGAYAVFGDVKKFFVRKYSTDRPDVITQFRINIYDYIEQNFNITRSPNRYEKKRPTGSNKDFYYFSFDYNGDRKYQELYAVSEYHFGRGIWEPHMSIIDTGDINELKTLHPGGYDVLYNSPIKLTLKM